MESIERKKKKKHDRRPFIAPEVASLVPFVVRARPNAVVMLSEGFMSPPSWYLACKISIPQCHSSPLIFDIPYQPSRPL